MTQQIQELINKIKTEGIHEAQNKAKQIESEAHQKAGAIVHEAKAKAEKIINAAKEETKKMQEAATVAIQQAARNSLLSLREDIENMLKGVVLAQVKDSLTTQQLSSILENIIKNHIAQNFSGNIQVTLNAQDARVVKESLIAKFQKQLKQPVQFKTSGEISKGFMISFDGGKSSFDFTDASLAEYLGAYVNEDIARLLRSPVS